MDGELTQVISTSRTLLSGLDAYAVSGQNGLMGALVTTITNSDGQITGVKLTAEDLAGAKVDSKYIAWASDATHVINIDYSAPTLRIDPDNANAEAAATYDASYTVASDCKIYVFNKDTEELTVGDIDDAVGQIPMLDLVADPAEGGVIWLQFADKTSNSVKAIYVLTASGLD